MDRSLLETMFAGLSPHKSGGGPILGVEGLTARHSEAPNAPFNAEGGVAQVHADAEARHCLGTLPEQIGKLALNGRILASCGRAPRARPMMSRGMTSAPWRRCLKPALYAGSAVPVGGLADGEDPATVSILSAERAQPAAAEFVITRRGGTPMAGQRPGLPPRRHRGCPEPRELDDEVVVDPP